MARKATSKIETVTKAAAETTALVPVKKPTTRKAAPKKPEKELDWSAMGKVSEWRASRQRMAIAQAAKQARAIDRLKLEYLYYAASCFFAGVTLGVMICNWLR